MADLFDEIESSPKKGDVFEEPKGDLFDELTQKEPSPTWEALKKTAEVMPASAAVAGAKFIKGVTLGAYEPEVATAKKFLKEKGAYIGEEPIYPYAGKAAEMLGEFLPIGAVMKVISPVVKFAMAGAGMVRTATTEAALAGLTYEAAKGAAQGKDPVKTLEEMGYAGPQWAGLGAVAGKLGAVLSKAKTAKPESVAADLAKAQEEIESTILYKPVKSELKLAPEWQPKPEYPSIPYTGAKEFQFKPSTETPMRIGPRPPEGGLEIPPMRAAPANIPERKLLPPPPDWIPGKPTAIRRPALETPPTAAEFKGPEKVFVESAKGPVEVKWNAEKKVYESISPSEKVAPAGGLEIPSGEVRKLAPDYVKGYLSQYKKGEPGISEGLTRADKSGELVYRDTAGKPVGVIAFSPKFITDVAVDPKFQRTGIATKLIEKVNKKGITEFRGPYSKEGAALVKAREIPPELSEPAKRALIRIEGKTVNGLAQDILSDTPAKQEAAINAVKKAVEEGKITQDEALHHVNNEMMNIATEKIKAGADLNSTLNAAQRAGMAFTEKIAKEGRPDAQLILRKLTGKPTPYLEEKINYGGEIKSRGSVNVEMQKQGLSEKEIGYYMMGQALKTKISGESGKVDLDLLRHITISGLGAATGATLDEENRWRGAIIGGAAGFTISRGLLNKVLGRKFTVETPATAREKIEVKPIREGSLTEPILNLGINKNIANATEDLFRAAGMKWDPELLITDQIATALKTVPVGAFEQILGNVDVPVEEFTKYYFRQSISKYAKGLGEWGAVVRRLMKNNPEAQAALDDISRAASDIDAATAAQNWWKRSDAVRRGLLVTQLATAMRNAETQAGRVGLDVFEQALDAGLQRLFKKRVTTNPLDGLESLMTLFRRGKKADTDKILNFKDPNGNPLFEGEFNRLFLTYSSDIMKSRGEGIPEKIVDTLNIANRFQEYAIRRTVFLSKLDQRLRSSGLDLETIVKNNEIGKIGEDEIKYAVNKALEFTWSQSPKYGSLAADFIKTVNRWPGLTFLLPFPRFLYNSLKFQFEYSPLGAFKLLLPAEKLAFKAGDMKTISRAILGTAMLGAAYQIRNSEYAGEKSYELNIGGRPIDMRAYNPFVSYLFVADVFKKWMDGTLYKLSASDLIQGLLSTNLRAGSGLYVVDRILDAFTSEGKAEKAMNVLKQFGGEIAGGFLTPVRQVRDFFNGFDDYTLKQTREEPFLGPIKAALPGLEAGLPPRYKPTRAEPAKYPAPALRQLTGISIGEAKNPVEKELDRLGFDRREILPSVGDARADNLIAQKMGSIMEEIGVPIIEGRSFREMPDAEKGYFLSRMIGKLRTAAKKEAQADDPELFEKIQRVSRRKEIFMKSLENQ